MRINEKEIRPGAKLGPMSYSHALVAINGLVRNVFPDLPANWSIRFSQPVSDFILHKYFKRARSAQGIIELLNPRMHKTDGNRTKFSTLTNLELEAGASLQIDDPERGIFFQLQGEVHFDGQVRGIAAASYTLDPSEAPDMLEARFYKEPLRPFVTEVSAEDLEKLSKAIDARNTEEQAMVRKSIQRAALINERGIYHPLRGGLPGSSRSH